LLTDAGFSFRVIPADIDEESAVSAITDPVAQARQLAFLKARAVADRLTAGVVLGADTLVSAGGRCSTSRRTRRMPGAFSPN
jgi:septum formation protein